MGGVGANRIYAQGIMLVALGKACNFPRDGGGEQQGAAVLGGGVQQGFQLIAEAEVEHFVCFVQHGGLELRQVEVTALEVVAQAAGRAYNNVAASGQVAGFRAGLHPPYAGHDPCAGFGIEPFQLAADLKSQLARGGNDQRHWCASRAAAVRAVKECICKGKAKGDRFARARAGGNQKVAAFGVIRQNGGLNRGRGFKPARGQSLGERGGSILERHIKRSRQTGMREGIKRPVRKDLSLVPGGCTADPQCPGNL